MKIFKFSTKQQAKTYTFFTVISVVISIYIFYSLDNFSMSSSVAYLIVVILSSISIMVSIKKASKTFMEIIVDGEKVKFCFANKMKDNLQIAVDKVIIKVTNSKIEIKNKETKELIGVVFKNRFKNEDQVKELIECFKHE